MSQQRTSTLCIICLHIGKWNHKFNHRKKKHSYMIVCTSTMYVHNSQIRAVDKSTCYFSDDGMLCIILCANNTVRSILKCMCHHHSPPPFQSYDGVCVCINLDFIRTIIYRNLFTSLKSTGKHINIKKT